MYSVKDRYSEVKNGMAVKTISPMIKGNVNT